MAEKCTLFFTKRQVIINCPVKKSLFFEKCFLLINYLFFSISYGVSFFLIFNSRKLLKKGHRTYE